MAVLHAKDDEFEAKVLQAEKPVLVDFWAEWCAPCKEIAPLLEELAEEYGDRLSIVKLNIDDNPDAPTKYNIRSIPTLILFRDGEAAANKIGAAGKSDIKKWLDASL